MRSYIREQRTICGAHYMEVDIKPVSEREHRDGARARKERESSEAQLKINERNARRYLPQLIHTNFGRGDLHVTLTYSDRHLPANPDEAARDLRLWLRRVNYRLTRRGLARAKYIAVTEYRESEEGDSGVRYHHHVVLSCDLSRDELEALWCSGPVERGEPLGLVNADRLQYADGTLSALCGYLLKYANRRRRWSQSRGLKKPQRPRPNDSRYTARQVERICKGQAHLPDFWESKYPGWWLREAEPIPPDDFIPYWRLILKFRRWDGEKGGPDNGGSDSDD